MSADRLSVWYGTSLVGIIIRTETDRMEFTYAGDWLAREFPISQSLPLDRGWKCGVTDHNYFANLLPEGLARQAIARRLGIAEDSDFGLLARLGRDCAGALVIVPECDNPVPRDIDYAPLPIAELTRAAHATTDGERHYPGGIVRFSFAGHQDKWAVYLDAHNNFFCSCRRRTFLASSPGTATVSYPATIVSEKATLSVDSTRRTHAKPSESPLRASMRRTEGLASSQFSAASVPSATIVPPTPAPLFPGSSPPPFSAMPMATGRTSPFSSTIGPAAGTSLLSTISSPPMPTPMSIASSPWPSEFSAIPATFATPIGKPLQLVDIDSKAKYFVKVAAGLSPARPTHENAPSLSGGGESAAWFQELFRR